jgi:hypothetical protein
MLPGPRTGVVQLHKIILRCQLKHVPRTAQYVQPPLSLPSNAAQHAEGMALVTGLAARLHPSVFHANGDSLKSERQTCQPHCWHSPKAPRRSKRQTICSHPIRSSPLDHSGAQPILLTLPCYQRRGKGVYLDRIICSCATTDGMAYWQSGRIICRSFSSSGSLNARSPLEVQWYKQRVRSTIVPQGRDRTPGASKRRVQYHHVQVCGRLLHHMSLQ